MQKTGYWFKNNVLAILIVSAVLSVIVFSLAKSQTEMKNSGSEASIMTAQIRQQLYDHQVVPVQIGDHRFWAEVVTTPASITQGLSGRSAIGLPPENSQIPASPSQGMLFVFDEKRVPTFWMKEMQFSLDMVWIEDGEIVEITSEVPAPESAQDQLPVYSPKQPVNMVLELEAGTAKKWGFEVGQTLLFPTLLSEETTQK